MKQHGALKRTFNRYMVYSTQSEAHSTQLSRYSHLQPVLTELLQLGYLTLNWFRITPTSFKNNITTIKTERKKENNPPPRMV